MLGNKINNIPDGWKVEHIEDFASIKTGTGDTQDREDGGKYPFFVRSNTIERVNKYTFDGEGVLTSGDGVGVGKIYHYVNGKFHYHQRVYNIHNFKPHVLGRYFYQFFRYRFFQRVSRMSAKGSVDSVRMEMIAKMSILIPTIEEQQKIADILSTVDKKIDLIDQKIAETEKLKTGLMQKLFSEGVGVQDENGEWQPHTEFYLLPTGEYPQAWQPKTLNDVCEKIGDGIHTTPKYVEDSEYRFVNGNNIKNGKLVITKKTKCVSKNEYDKHKKELSLDTILLSINGTIGSLAYYDGSSIVLGKSAAYLSPKEMIQKEFLYYYLSTSNVSKWFAMGLTGTTIKNLSLKTIRNTPIAIPHFKEQAAITSILTEVDKKVALLKAQKHETQQLKKGLMQKLLTGKWRVPVEETEAA
ncbi:restriction endonuclease subunit S [Vibrio parahaemolyticus]|uniref:restriction endonuclease subunit S n=1 Tax=Vibrio TaxID=662 RepID=UPI00041002C1|nr:MULTISPECIES: restriction endonuclease subunit S [Vibrio]EGQ8050831.1 restriction endonuclease subunit S [Vibrio parahaemolyticus]EGQ9656229.1 restriction endonuclease subunit S [Vibrio parahaemolyticus]EGR0250993.1 restriction endonuclease subunit S [Vibrio parahaemolyticus]EGR0283332.1 restriction endonuclease subunit S [Vibrio parahaemolyticus]EGR1455574.1 restriction endonuclease subunit S [Vibrio parahaemolyticus]